MLAYLSCPNETFISGHNNGTQITVIALMVSPRDNGEHTFVDMHGVGRPDDSLMVMTTGANRRKAHPTQKFSK